MPGTRRSRNVAANLPTVLRSSPFEAACKREGPKGFFSAACGIPLERRGKKRILFFGEGAKLLGVQGARLSRIHVHTTWAHPLFFPQSEFFPPQFGDAFSCIRETKISPGEDSEARTGCRKLANETTGSFASTDLTRSSCNLFF